MRDMIRMMFMALTALTAVSLKAADYTGNNVLLVLGVGVNTPQFKEIKSYWVLNKDYASSYSGIKLYVNDITEKVDGVLIAGEGLNVNNERFDKYTAKLPFGLSLNDDTSMLTRKLGPGEKLLGRNALKFFQKSLAIEVSYTDLARGKISAIKIYRGAGAPLAEVNHVATAPVAASSTYTKPVTNKTAGAPVAAVAETRNIVAATPFKRSIMEIFKAYRESAFASVKEEPRSESNFWNYKYTYKTRLSVPGELYSMLYNFPFAYSQNDFVVVIKEADHYDESFDAAYHSFEKQLMDNFKTSDGWVSACISGSNKPKLPDLELRNDKIGAVILDCSQNPRGKQVLYLRFLFFSN